MKSVKGEKGGLGLAVKPCGIKYLAMVLRVFLLER